MTEDVLANARGALSAGRVDAALRLAWDATMPAVLSQDSEQLARSAAFAEEVASIATGGAQREAREHAAYWTACIVEPRDQQASAWNIKSWFTRAPKEERYPCPQCAEMIMVQAKVCRFCGHTL